MIKTAWEKTKQGLNWTFNNNGNVVDERYRRITDFSPVGTTGLRRAFSGKNWIYGAVFAVPLAVSAATNKDKPIEDILGNAPWGITSIFAMRKLRKFGLNKTGINTQTHCIDTQPETITSPIHSLYKEYSSQNKIAECVGTGIGWGISLAIKPLEAYTYLPFTLDVATTIKTNNRIEKDEWAIIETPPLQKKVSQEQSTPEFTFA